MEPRFADRLKHIRKKRGLTQKELAKACDLNPTHISKFEAPAKGKQDVYPRTDVLIKLSKALDVSIDYLLLGKIHSGGVAELQSVIQELQEQQMKERSILNTLKSLISEDEN